VVLPIRLTDPGRGREVVPWHASSAPPIRRCAAVEDHDAGSLVLWVVIASIIIFELIGIEQMDFFRRAVYG
jgi:hypothetical protein